MERTYKEYGGFVLNVDTNERECLFVTNCSELLAMHRAYEKAEEKNKYLNGSYLLDDITVRTRTVTEIRSEWE